MDRQTLSNYGWIVIAVLVLSVMLALATPFGQFIELGVKNTLFGLIDTSDNAIGIIGVHNPNTGSGGGEQTEPTIPDDALIFNEGELIPVGGIYTQGYEDEDGNWIETNYLVGNGIDVYFPKIQAFDTFIYENYGYEYLDGTEIIYEQHTEPLDGWCVWAEDYDLPVGEKIATKINGKYVKDANCTFSSHETLVTSPELPVTIEYMNGTYEGCTSLVSMPEIPQKVKSLDGAFCSCTSLSNITTIPDGVTSMWYTFADCTSLSTAPAIPSSVTCLDETFYGCSSLITTPDMSNAVGITEFYNTFTDCHSIKNVPSLPPNLTNVDYLFENYTSLETVGSLPIKITSMENTFAGCTSLKSIGVIPSSVTSMNSTFAGCASLKNAPAISQNVSETKYTFFGCKSLKEVTVNSNKLSEEKAEGFLAGTSKEVYIIGNCNEEIKNMICKLNTGYDGTECVHYLSDEIIPVGGIYKLDDNHDAIVGDGTKKFIFPMKSRTTFEYGDYIYYYNVNVTAASGYKSFYENFNAEKQYWAVDTKEHKATYGDMLDSIAGKNVEDLEGLFYRNFVVTTVPKLSKNAKILDSFCEQAKSLTDAGVLPEGVVSMYDAFNEATALKKAPIIPSSVKYMSSTFYNCSSLESFPVIPENVETMSYCFTFCKSIKGNLMINTEKITDANSVKGALAVTNTQEVTVSCANEQIKNWILATLTDK